MQPDGQDNKKQDNEGRSNVRRGDVPATTHSIEGVTTAHGYRLKTPLINYIKYNFRNAEYGDPGTPSLDDDDFPEELHDFVTHAGQFKDPAIQQLINQAVKGEISMLDAENQLTTIIEETKREALERAKELDERRGDKVR